ncbi:zinc finger A20 and AN1 domain-containing stress-associated protein 4-like [Eucalyptus grandis]|uniref:zinc finger A20 and AN1 domain-containing stress-associated protein 4-like n=1 Tax=Eucalyptus grandis TaxID=71139 RepID=UPI00192E85D8|nr:zinc finger A20 and AN1 domain-containing stress-associated protein 4-like [Eucalyptus grandis]XP_039166306.1 zinc finger A20 and AN1 domain-containing stress-associated protein 4-like [Eucalyptus grandis]XP_039166312.1 zinc finger A20 and AN1 domain-containing stress-associated protein 4-like [Eucalyptus grandis]XP_039166320.1 zinc finger A20 and AN1 domain-containing stress-associated protein 4-like [Eucalyptus grandis]
MEFPNGMGWQSTKGCILCINCGFFGSAAMGNMCSKCHKDMLQKREQAELAASSSTTSIGAASSGESGKEHAVAGARDVHSGAVDVEASSITSLPESTSTGNSAALLFRNLRMNVKEGPNRCTACRKRVGLTGFNCRCGNLFCAAHRHADEHDCSIDYWTANRAALTKRNPIVKAEKLGKI